jgi:carbon-monoxide dehydrogenase iron sulfur subunit
MGGELLLNPAKCTGCSTCALTCSLIHHGTFNPDKSNIRITKYDFEGLFMISFLSTCNNCRQCAQVCPSGALRKRDTGLAPGEGKSL